MDKKQSNEEIIVRIDKVESLYDTLPHLTAYTQPKPNIRMTMRYMPGFEYQYIGKKPNIFQRFFHYICFGFVYEDIG